MSETNSVTTPVDESVSYPNESSPVDNSSSSLSSYSSSDDGDDEVLVPRLGHISSRRRHETPSPPFGHRSAKTSEKTPKAQQPVGLGGDKEEAPVSPLVLDTDIKKAMDVKTAKEDATPPPHVRSNVFFSPLSPEFTPKWTQPIPPPPSKTPNLIEFPSPESGSSKGTPTEELTEEDKDSRWTFTEDGQLIDNSGGQWELAPEIMRLQGGGAPVMTPTKPRLLPTARPWSPSPLRNEQRPDSVSTVVPDPEAERKKYCVGELGEPDNSYPFTAFSTWRQKQLMSSIPPPPSGMGANHRRHRSGSDGSASSAGSHISMSYLPTTNTFRQSTPSPGTGTPVFESPRAAFAQFEAIHSRRSSLGSQGDRSSSQHQHQHQQGPPPPHVANSMMPFVGPPRMQPDRGGMMTPSLPMGFDNPLAALYQIANQAAINPELGQAVMRLAGLSVGNAPVPVMGPSPHNRKLGLYKTELCRSWEEKGSCRYGAKCQFAHGREELRQISRHNKTEICRAYQNQGACPYGKRCVFRHEPFPGMPDQPTGFIPPRPALPGALANARYGGNGNGNFGNAVNGYLGSSSSSSSTSSHDERNPGSPTFYDAVLAQSSNGGGSISMHSRNSSEGSFGGSSPWSFPHTGRVDESGRFPHSSPGDLGPMDRVEKLRSTPAHPLPPPRALSGGGILSSLAEDSMPVASPAIWNPAPPSARVQLAHPSTAATATPAFAPFDFPLLTESLSGGKSTFNPAPGARPVA